MNQINGGCTGFMDARPTRRDLLRVGGIGLLGLQLPELVAAADQNKTAKARAKSVIFLHQFGGPSHHDTFDMKPTAVDSIRGEYKPIRSKSPDILVCEHLPRIAQVADKFTLIRTMQHGMKNHNPATYYSLTGHAPPLDDIRLRDSRELFPAYGSVVSRLSPAKNGMPTFVSYPHLLRDGSVTPGQHATFLGKAHDPFFVGQDPNSSNFRLPELSLPANLTLERLESRREVQRLIDRQSELLDYSALAQGIDSNVEKALTMISSGRVRKAFDLGEESASIRDKYGRTTYGQSCLLARRLVEAGAKFINVYFSNVIGGRSGTGGWDTHGFGNNPMYPILKDYLLPLADQTLPTLLEDLDSRGLLNETLVVWMGEFGRSPRINNLAGRDHWPQCYTALVAGGGTKRGFVHGASDKLGAYPTTDSVRPDDLAATIFFLLGIDPHTEVRDPVNKPLQIAQGNPVMDIVA